MTQVISEMSAAGRVFEAFYFRTSDQYEADLVLEVAGELWALEVKLTAAPGPDDLRRLDKVAGMIGASRRFLLTRTPRPAGDEHRASLDLPSFLKLLRTGPLAGGSLPHAPY